MNDYDYTYDIDDAVNLCAARLNAINALLTSHFQDKNDVDVANAYINSIKTDVIMSPGIEVTVGKVKNYQAPVLFSMMAYSSGCYKAKVEPFLKNQEKINKRIVYAIREKITTDPSKYYNLINHNEMQIKTQLLKKLSNIFKKNSAEWNTESKKVFGEWEWNYNFVTSKAAAEAKAATEAKAAAEDYEMARKYRYGWAEYGIFMTNKAKAEELYKRAADAGHSEAQYDLANIYNRRASLAEAERERYKRMADNSNLNVLAESDRADSEARDEYANAVKYYKLAADQMNMGAQYTLGTMYLYGDGVEKNPAEAERLLGLAADQMHVNAKGLLEKMKMKMGGGSRKTKVSKTKYRKHHSHIRSRSRNRRVVKSKSKSKTKRRQKNHYININKV